MNAPAAGGGAIGLLGVGLVGSALAARLLEHGYRVLGYDVRPDRVRALEGLGGSGAADAAGVGRECEIVLVSVLTSAQASQAIEGEAGLLSGAFRTRTIVDTTTADPADSAAIAERLAGRGVSYLDAPLSGSSRQIREGEGVFLVGGDAAAWRRLGDLFGCLCRAQFHLGPPGAGARAKIASNLVLGLNRLALAEGLVFAERLGLDTAAFLEVLRESPAYSKAIDIKGAKMLAGDYSPESRISQHRKDLDIILRHGERTGQPLPLARVHHEILRMAEENGFADADTCAVIEQIRQLAERREER